MAAQPPLGHVHLVIYEPESFHPEIWCVLGVEGSLQNGQGHEVDLNGNLVDAGVYYCSLLPPTQQDILSHAVDLEVIAMRSQVPSQSTESSASFRRELAERDGERCVWTNLPVYVGMHIIPRSRGDERLQLIIGNRPHGNERNLNTLRSVNDIRNGIMGTPTLHSCIDSRAAVILNTPNRILQMDDVPERHDRTLRDGRHYPTSSRYTLQWLANDDPDLRDTLPNSSDAAFLSSQKPKPSEHLLHYNYGAAAVKNWGRNHTVLGNRAGFPRPQAPDRVPMGPTRDRMATNELENAWAKHVQQPPANNGGSAEATDSERRLWDEDDVMLFFWGNSGAAMERHAKKEQERKDIINKWRFETTNIVSADT